MSDFNFTIRFDGSGSVEFTNNKGLRLDQISLFIKCLYDVLGIDASNKITIDEIKRESQSFVFSTPEKITQGKLKIIHENISKLDINTISSKEIDYAKVLKEIRGWGGVKITAFDNNNGYFVDLNNFELPETNVKHYFETKIVYGSVARIGNERIAMPSYLDVDLGFGKSIKVSLSESQDKALKQFYKDKKIKFKIRVKKKMQDKSIIGSAELLDFEPVSSDSFTDNIKKLKQKGDIIDPNVNTDDYLNDIRNNK